MRFNGNRMQVNNLTGLTAALYCLLPLDFGR